MHLQMGIIKIVAAMVYDWVDDLGHGDTLVRYLQTGIDSLRRACRVDKYRMVHYTPAMAGWVADNCRAMCLLMPWAYQCLAQDLFTYRPYVQPATPLTEWRQVECASYLKSRGEPIGSHTVAQLRAVIQQAWMTRPAGPPPVLVPPSCRVDGPVMLQMLWHCHHMFKSLFADTVDRSTALSGVDGEIDLTNRNAFLELVKCREDNHVDGANNSLHNDDSSDSTTLPKKRILVPSPMDIILGRGRRPKAAPGHLMKAPLLEHMKAYEISEKVVIADLVLKRMKDSGCRFLLRFAAGGFVECEDTEAHNKILHDFRNARGKRVRSAAITTTTTTTTTTSNGRQRGNEKTSTRKPRQSGAWRRYIAAKAYRSPD
jgi:hypothetical protein